MRGLTLNMVSGRLHIPKRSDELTVAAVGGNLLSKSNTLTQNPYYSVIKANKRRNRNRKSNVTFGNHRK